MNKKALFKHSIMSNIFIKAQSQLSIEWLKLKSTPGLYLALTCGLLISFLVFITHLMEVHSLTSFGVNPWRRYFTRGLAIFSLFVSVPFVLLLVSAVVNVERQANAWKYLYTLPIRRGNIYFSKLVVLLLLLALSLFLLVFGLVLSGYVLDSIHPEFELAFYQPDLWELGANAVHTWLSLLGLVGLQYFLSLRFQHFLLPLGLGILGYVFGLILAVTQNTVALYCPFSYPMLVQDFGMFRIEIRASAGFAGLNNIELYSLGFFLFFVLLGWIWENRRSVS